MGQLLIGGGGAPLALSPALLDQSAPSNLSALYIAILEEIYLANYVTNDHNDNDHNDNDNDNDKDSRITRHICPLDCVYPGSSRWLPARRSPPLLPYRPQLSLRGRPLPLLLPVGGGMVAGLHDRLYPCNHHWLSLSFLPKNRPT